MTDLRDNLRLKLQRFTSIGAFGFVADSAVFFPLVHLARVDHVVARIVASLLALVVTWLLNRTITFHQERSAPLLTEFSRYLAASSVGASANIGAFYVIAPYDEHMWHVPAYLTGTAAGLVINFLLYDRFVFLQRASQRTPPDPGR